MVGWWVVCVMGGWMGEPLVSVWMGMCGGLVGVLCGCFGWVGSAWGGVVRGLCEGSDGVWRVDG